MCLCKSKHLKSYFTGSCDVHTFSVRDGFKGRVVVRQYSKCFLLYKIHCAYRESFQTSVACVSVCVMWFIRTENCNGMGMTYLYCICIKLFYENLPNVLIIQNGSKSYLTRSFYNQNLPVCLFFVRVGFRDRSGVRIQTLFFFPAVCLKVLCQALFC